MTAQGRRPDTLRTPVVLVCPPGAAAGDLYQSLTRLDAPAIRAGRVLVLSPSSVAAQAASLRPRTVIVDEVSAAAVSDALSTFRRANSNIIVVGSARPAGLLQTLTLRLGSPVRQLSPAILSASEAQFLRLISNGRSNDEIAKDLGITSNTVKTRARRLFSKLAVSNRTELVAVAFRSGLLS